MRLGEIPLLKIYPQAAQSIEAQQSEVMQKALLRSVIWSLTLWLSICLPGMADTNQAVLRSEFGKETVPFSAERKGTVPFSFHENWDSLRKVCENWDSPQNWDSPCILEQRLFADAEDGRLDEFSLLDAALIASGVDNTAELGRYRGCMEAWAEQLRQKGGLDGSPRRRVEAIFEFLHGKILKGKYNIQYTDLRQAIDEGRFNCLSATVLFNYLAGEMGLSCCGLETPGHALSRVFLPDGQLDVETTCPRWFCLRHDPLLNNAERKGTAQKGTVPFSPTMLFAWCPENWDSPQETGLQKTIGGKPAKDKAKPREISPVQLTAMIYYNRGIDFLGEKRFADAAAANAKALRLDPFNSTARGNFLATINNWAIDLGNAGQYAQAAALLRQGLAFDPHYEAFALNFVYVSRQWSRELCKEGKYSEAVEVLKQCN
ncbi:MAG: tetratricopeptide repeat protein [Thermoguttaceae bacterium]